MPLPRCLAFRQELQLPWYSLDALRNAGLEYVFRVCENQPCTEDIVRPAWNQYCEVMRRAGIDLDCNLVINPTEGFAWVPRLSAHEEL